jgi:hypothetical protein
VPNHEYPYSDDDAFSKDTGFVEDIYPVCHDLHMVFHIKFVTSAKRAMSRTICTNLYPIRHSFDYEIGRAQYLYVLINGASIDCCRVACQVMVLPYSFSPTSLSLHFPSLITHLAMAKSVYIDPSEVVVAD